MLPTPFRDHATICSLPHRVVAGRDHWFPLGLEGQLLPGLSGILHIDSLLKKILLGDPRISPAMFSDLMEPGTASFGPSEGGRPRRFPRASAPEGQESLDVLPRSDHEGL